MKVKRWREAALLTYCCFSLAPTGVEHMACHAAPFWREVERGAWSHETEGPAMEHDSLENDKIYTVRFGCRPPK